MPLLDAFRVVRDQTRDQRNSFQANNGKLGWRFLDIFTRMWDLGFTAFGGPPVHFQILHRRFVEGVGGKTKWIDEQTYQELFAICQALPGPGSTKMTFCIALIHAGFIPALFAFALWSLPGAIGMYALSLGVQKMPEVLPSIVYVLLSGMNASTVGIIALAAVQLAEKAITDKLTRILVIFGACAGLCYNALWYFPVLIVIGGIVTVIWDTWLRQQVDKFKAKRERKRREATSTERTAEEIQPIEMVGREGSTREGAEGLQRRTPAPGEKEGVSGRNTPNNNGAVSTETRDSVSGSETSAAPAVADMNTHAISIKVGISIIIAFFIILIVILVLRGTLKSRPLTLDLFANLFLAGTIIFGGGPVVIPLLSAYVVEPGWVSSRDFLLGLAIIQAFPGPNFNFAVYLAALAMAPTNVHTVFGAMLGFVGIFTPGITLAVGVQSLWRVLRTKPPVIALLRGINATAVGLVFTAVYRLWEIGYLTPQATRGKSLASEPWWVVVAAVTYAETAWFKVPPAMAIVLGSVLGLAWYGAVGR
ncbi:chromate transporter family protein [Westerdykella ornata]|uniref:Chromate transporter family protein n=1 Tax=Westerdykella ornata TaxID=318751 RepID=A0A6A6JI99_WESOR|nr:chromate transporter family protein [Westerdykella ornata]KAF2274979.1 chromate transporter family protein [Westerdykella ornata]